MEKSKSLIQSRISQTVSLNTRSIYNKLLLIMFYIVISSVLLTFTDHFNQIVNILSEKLRAKADNKTVVGLMNEINRATLDAISLVSS